MYVKLLKCNNSAASYDGIMAEHLKQAMHSQLPILLYNMFKVCVKFGVLPQQCKIGILVPLLKKTALDPTVPNSYRPFTVSCIISKILEHFMSVSTNHVMHNLASWKDAVLEWRVFWHMMSVLIVLHLALQLSTGVWMSTGPLTICPIVLFLKRQCMWSLMHYGSYCVTGILI